MKRIFPTLTLLVLVFLLTASQVGVARGQDVAFFPANAGHGAQYGGELRWGESLRRAAQVPDSAAHTPIDLTTVQLDLVVPTVLEAFIEPHIGMSWGNYGVPAGGGTFGASKAWSFDFGFALTWIAISAAPYGAHAMSLFNLEFGVDLVGAISSMRTGSAAGGVVDIQSDFLLDLRPLLRFVFFFDRQWSATAGVEISMFDLVGTDDFIHGHGTDLVARRASQFTLGVQFNPGGRTLTVPATEAQETRR